MATIYLFRHGQTDFNLKKIFTGWLQSQLTPQGIKQAQEVADLLKNKHLNVAYVSNLKRCQDTLDIVLKHHPECREVFIDDRLLERSYGDLSGRSHQEIIDSFGQEQFNKWHRGWDDRPPSGESLADVELRVGEFINYLRQKYTNQDINLAISASGNSIRLFRKIMEDASIQETTSWVIPYDKYFEYNL